MACCRKQTEKLLGDNIPSENEVYVLDETTCSVSGEGTMHGRGGTITAAVDVPGGPSTV